MKKIVIFLTLTFLLSGCSQASKTPVTNSNARCSSHYTITCYGADESQINRTIKQGIPCSNDGDCSIEKMNKACRPGQADMLLCAGAQYYCGDQGACQGCDCPAR